MPVTPEQINLSAGSEDIDVRDNMRIHVEPNFRDNASSLYAHDTITLRGSNNSLSLPGEDLNSVSLRIAAGTTNHIRIRNSERLADFQFPSLSVSGMGHNPSALWSRDEQGRHQILVYVGAGTPTRLTIELEPSTSETRARFEDNLRFRYIGVEEIRPPRLSPRYGSIPLRSVEEAVQYSRDHSVFGGHVNPPPIAFNPFQSARQIGSAISGSNLQHADDIGTPPSHDTVVNGHAAGIRLPPR